MRKGLLFYRDTPDFRFRKIPLLQKCDGMPGFMFSAAGLPGGSRVDEKKRSLQEVCELAIKEYNEEKLSELVEEMLELLSEAQKQRKDPPASE